MTIRHWRFGILWTLLLALLCTTAFAQEMEVSTWEELAQTIESAQKGDVITLTGDITMTGDKALANKKNQEITIDLGGYTLRSALFSQGAFSIRNGSMELVVLEGEGKGVSVSVEESVTCKGVKDLSAVSMGNKKGEVSFSNAGRIEGLFGVTLLHEKSGKVTLTNTGTILADAYALEFGGNAGGSLTVVNDGRMESRFCAAVHLQQSKKKAATVSITGTGELVGACGVHAEAESGGITIDQRVTAVYTAEKSEAVAKQEQYRTAYFRQIFGFDAQTSKDMGSLRKERINGVAVAFELADTVTPKLTVSGTLSATNKLLLVPAVLPYSSKAKLTINASVNPDSQSDFFDVWLPLEKVVDTFDEVTAEKKLKANMTRLDVDGFLESGGRLRACVSEPMTNPEGKLLVSVSRSVLMQELLGGYLTADGMHWDADVARNVYNTCAPQQLTEVEDVSMSFNRAAEAKGQYALYLDCDVTNATVWRADDRGRLYVEGNGYTLWSPSIRASALTLRGLTARGLTEVNTGVCSLEATKTEMLLENCQLVEAEEDNTNSSVILEAKTKMELRNCLVSNVTIREGKQVTLEDCRFKLLSFYDVEKVSLAGVIAKDENGKLYILNGGEFQLDEDCEVPVIWVSAEEGENVHIINNSPHVRRIVDNGWGGQVKVTGDGYTHVTKNENP